MDTGSSDFLVESPVPEKSSSLQDGDNNSSGGILISQRACPQRWCALVLMAGTGFEVRVLLSPGGILMGGWQGRLCSHGGGTSSGDDALISWGG